MKSLLGLLTTRERDVVEELQRRQDGTVPDEGEFALGNILVADGQITPDQLESALRRQAATGRRLGEELIRAGHASKGQVDGGLVLQHKLIGYALFAAVVATPMAALTASAEAAQRNVAMTVSATVIASARLRSIFQATQLVLTEADVQRGYVEVGAASRFSVMTNSRSGYRMEFRPVGNLFESVQVHGLGDFVQLGPDGGSIVQRGPLPANLSHELSFRFALGPDAQPGLYPWPLQLSVRPL